MILSCCNFDANNPYIREHAIMCLRFLLEGNRENSEIVRALEPRKGVPEEMLNKRGLWEKLTLTPLCVVVSRIKIPPYVLYLTRFAGKISADRKAGSMPIMERRKMLMDGLRGMLEATCVEVTLFVQKPQLMETTLLWTWHNCGEFEEVRAIYGFSLLLNVRKDCHAEQLRSWAACLEEGGQLIVDVPHPCSWAGDGCSNIPHPPYRFPEAAPAWCWWWWDWPVASWFA